MQHEAGGQAHQSRPAERAQGEHKRRGREPRPSKRSLRGLDWLNFLLADMQSALGPFLAIYVATRGWNEERVGLALTIGGIAGIIAQTPTGALVDRVRSKRTLIALGASALAIGAMVIAFAPSFVPVMMAQALIGAMSSLFLPTIAAVSLGLVGQQLFDRRQGRNQAYNSAGNIAAAIIFGLLGYFISDRTVFFLVALLSIPTILTLKLIRPDEIDYRRARGGAVDDETGRIVSVRLVLRDRVLAIFLFCSVLFHLANAAMLPLLGEMLTKGKGRSSMLFMSACVITTQLTITIIAPWIGRLAGERGRKPLLLLGFGVLPIRAVLYTLAHSTYPLVAIQVLDGVAAGIFGVVSALVIADLSGGTGRFNLTLGALATAVGIGASLSQTVAALWSTALDTRSDLFSSPLWRRWRCWCFGGSCLKRTAWNRRLWRGIGPLHQREPHRVAIRRRKRD